MKLDKLWIKEFKNLKDFEIDFDENQTDICIDWS